MSDLIHAIPRGSADHPDSRTWHAVRRDAQVVVYLVCVCHQRGSLEDHDIAEDGTVTPSVVCPICGRHVHVWLHDWPGWDAIRNELLNRRQA